MGRVAEGSIRGSREREAAGAQPWGPPSQQVTKAGDAMKDKRLIYQADPCTIHLDDPLVQRLEDTQGALTPCAHSFDRLACSPPEYGCVQLAGARVARHVIMFYFEASEETLAMEIERFGREAPLPPHRVKGYMDSHKGEGQLITDPAVIVDRVRAYARAALDLRPGDRILRDPEEAYAVPDGREKSRSAANRDRVA